MRFAISTLGLPGSSLAEAVEVAVRHGVGGLELRLHPDMPLDADPREAGLEVVSICGYIRIAETGPDEPVIDALRAQLALADRFGALGVRVFPGGPDAEAALRRLAAVAGESRARVLVETHDHMATGAAVGALLDRFGRPEAAGAIWDVLHPWRNGEDPAATFEALAPHLAYVQIKDAAGATPRPMGLGEVPLNVVGALLRDYPGWFSLEWEKAWHPEVEPLDEVIPGAREWVRSVVRSG
ncbi:sugar phosphate isomerase/epimerase family protein [Herbidospora yilanensis]|uniref:sugar phosphate isomerase/epimerase family protein n=1 Tax=Herbidospora yilanensis TaxID=354426 RepID=UPI000786303C|nr:sugar phosphate isomerase/epimerase [Herbidospora yilanensis]